MRSLRLRMSRYRAPWAGVGAISPSIVNHARTAHERTQTAHRHHPALTGGRGRERGSARAERKRYGGAQAIGSAPPVFLAHGGAPYAACQQTALPRLGGRCRHLQRVKGRYTLTAMAEYASPPSLLMMVISIARQWCETDQATFVSV